MMIPRLVCLALGAILAVASGATLTAPDDLGALKVDLRDSNKWARKTAVERLARLGTPDAWAEVVSALNDTKGEVADTAQLLLAGIDDPRALGHLTGRDGLGAKDADVRARAVEALGRTALAAEERLLVKALRDREGQVRRMACWTVERRAQDYPGDRVTHAIERLATRDRVDQVRARALHALARLDRVRAREALRSSGHADSPALRCAVAALAVELLGEQETAELLEELAADPALAVRTRAARSLGELATPAALRSLVRRLAEEDEVRLRLRLVDELRRISGLKHRADPRPWQDWVDGLPAGWRASPPDAEPAEEGADERPADERSVALAGLPILSGRLAFLVDLSGSIWNEREDGRTKKEIIDGKLAEVLQRLPETTLFNVIPFTGKPHPWEDHLVPATGRNVRDAIRYFEGCHEQGSGNVWDAAMLALEDPAVDTLLILTDGLPTGGRRHQLELMVPLFLELDATRQVAVDSILVDAPRKLRAHWARLAAGTGGRSISIEL